MTCEEFKKGLFRLKTPGTNDLLLEMGRHTESCDTCCSILAEYLMKEADEAEMPE